MSEIVCRNISISNSNSLVVNQTIAESPNRSFLVNGYTVREFPMPNNELTPDIIKNMDSLMRLKGCPQIMYLDAACIKINKAILYLKPEMRLTLGDYISKVDYRRRAKSTYKVFRELLEGVIAMSKLNIKHGKINPDNILVNFNDDFMIDKVCYYNFQHIENNDCGNENKSSNIESGDIYDVLNLINTYITTNDYIEYSGCKKNDVYTMEDFEYLELITAYFTRYANINAENILRDLNGIKGKYENPLFPWGNNVNVNKYDDLFIHNNIIIINSHINKFISRDVWNAIVKINETMKFNIITTLINIEILSRYYAVSDKKSKYDILATSRLASLYTEKKSVEYIDYYRTLNIENNDDDIINLKNTEIKIYSEINYIIYNSFIITSICRFYSNVKGMCYKSRYEILLESYDTLFM